MNLYERVGAERGMDAEEINRVCREALRRAHPDAGGTAEDFGEVSAAARVLRDKEARAEYDRTGRVPEEKTDTTEGQAQALLSGLVHRLLVSGEDFWHLDVVDTMRREVEKSLGETRIEMKQLERAQGRAERLRDGRLRARTKAEQVRLTGILNHHLGEIGRALEARRHKAAVEELALGRLGEWDFERDRSEVQWSQLNQAQSFGAAPWPWMQRRGP